jgi:Kef-type K+ transport system membrane component KefB
MVRSAVLLLLVVLVIASARSFLPQETSLVGSGGTLAFGFIVVAALQAGNMFAAVKMPRITGYLVLGALVGPSLLNYVTARMLEDLAIVNNMAIGLIALSAGAELNIRRVLPRLRAIAQVAFIAIPITATGLTLAIYTVAQLPLGARALPFLATLSGRETLAASIVMGVVLASVSPMVTLAIVKELGAAGPTTDTVLGIVVLGDLLIVFAFAAAHGFAGTTFGSPGTPELPSLLLHIGGSLGFGVGIGIVFLFYARFVQRQLPLFVLVIVFLCAEGGVRVHLDPLLICLAAGLTMENLARRRDPVIAAQLGPAQIPVFAVFFAAAGAKLDLKLFLVVAPVAAALALVRAALLLVLGWASLQAAGVPSRQRSWIPVGLLSQSGISIGLCILVRKQFPGWGEGAATCLLGVVMLNELVGPVLFKISLVRAGEAGQRAADSQPH